MSEGVKNRCRPLELSDNLLKEVMKRLDEAISAGLKKETHPQAIVKCFPTFVQELPHGDEEGKYFALDLGGTNFRVLMIDCETKGCRMDHETFPISPELMTGPGDQLFDYIAKCIADFVQMHDVQDEELHLGFTFSFPVSQNGLTEGYLVKWTKGFKCEGVEGQNVTALLKDAVDRRNDLNLSIVALLNDTVGCLVSCSYEHKDCKVGVIVGTGFNACYVEKCQNVTTFDNKLNKPFIIINTEWSAFGSDGALDFVLTEFDRIVDESSINPGQQIFEKMVAGMYMGEIVRLIMEKCTKEGVLFSGEGSTKLFTPGSFTTKDISKIESTQSGNLGVCTTVLKEKLDLPHATAQDCLDVHYICRTVSTRSAHLTSAGIACLINRTDFKPITVGVDGSVYRYHPHYHTLLMEKIPSLLTTPRDLSLVLSKDGSGRGAAFVAAVASEEKKEQERKAKEEAALDEKRKERLEYEREMYNQQNPLLVNDKDPTTVNHLRNHQSTAESQQRQKEEREREEHGMQKQDPSQQKPGDDGQNLQTSWQKQKEPKENPNQQQLQDLQQTMIILAKSIQDLQKSIENQKQNEESPYYQDQSLNKEQSPNQKQNEKSPYQEQNEQQSPNQKQNDQQSPNQKQPAQTKQPQNQFETMQNLQRSMQELTQTIQNLQRTLENQKKSTPPKRRQTTPNQQVVPYDQQSNRNQQQQNQQQSNRNQQQNHDDDNECLCCVELQVDCDCDC